MANQPIYAVITGDFIGFSGLDRPIRQAMPGVMDGAGRCLRELLPGVMPHEISVFRGDSWQALVAAPVYALRAAVLIRTYIRVYIGHPKVDTRMAIGMGPVDYVPGNQVAAGDGEGFRRSGKMLEKMASPKAGLLRYCYPDAPFEALVDALVRNIGELISAWRPPQARAVLGVLQGRNQAQIASQWPHPISRQAVSKHLKNACWPAVAHGLAVFEDAHKATK
ncbi:MAG: hypothetical protein ACOCS6_02630 [Desulfosalsimonas sp.]